VITVTIDSAHIVQCRYGVVRLGLVELVQLLLQECVWFRTKERRGLSACYQHSLPVWSVHIPAQCHLVDHEF